VENVWKTYKFAVEKCAVVLITGRGGSVRLCVSYSATAKVTTAAGIIRHLEVIQRTQSFPQFPQHFFHNLTTFILTFIILCAFQHTNNNLVRLGYHHPETSPHQYNDLAALETLLCVP